MKVEQPPVLLLRCLESVHEQPAKGSAKPVVGGDIETDFPALGDGKSEFRPHQFLEHVLLDAATNLELGREAGSKLEDAVVEERGTHLNRMRHTHAIGFDQ